MLQSRATTYNALKTIHTVIAEGRNKLYFVQLLQTQNIARQAAAEGMSHTTIYLTCLATPNKAARQVARQVAKKLAPCKAWPPYKS